MANKKKQHYIPRFYMKNFAKNKVFSVFNIKNRKIISPAPYKDQCFKDYFYGKDNILEDILAEKETKWAEAIRSLLEEEPLTPEIIQLLKEFALYQQQRTNAMKTFNIQARKELLIEMATQIYIHRGWKFDNAARKYCEERAKEDVAPSEYLLIAEKMQKYIEDLGLLVVTYNTTNKLISSDMPVISINPFYPPNIGYSVMGLIILFPISPHKLVVIYDDKMYPKFKGTQYTILNNEKEVINLNVLQLISAESILYGINTDEFYLFKKDHWEARKRNRDRDAMSSLGPDGHKLMIYGNRPNIYHCDLSFGKMCGEFSRIPFPCREAVLRQWDEKYEEKLVLKGQIIPTVSEHDTRFFTKLNMTKKEYVKNCHKMYKLAKKYWNGYPI